MSGGGWKWLELVQTKDYGHTHLSFTILKDKPITFQPIQRLTRKSWKLFSSAWTNQEMAREPWDQEITMADEFGKSYLFSPNKFDRIRSNLFFRKLCIPSI